MNIKGEFREQLLEHERHQLISEGKLTDKIGKYIDKFLESLVSFLKKNGKTLLEKLGVLEIKRKVEDYLSNFGGAYNDYKAGKLNPKNPNYDKEADIKAWNVLKDGLKVLGFMGINMALNYFLVGTGFAAGMAFIHFRKKFPNLLHDFFFLTVDKVKEKIDEFMGLMEDMSYFHADDATRDQYSIGTQ